MLVFWLIIALILVSSIVLWRRDDKSGKSKAAAALVDVIAIVMILYTYPAMVEAFAHLLGDVGGAIKQFGPEFVHSFSTHR